MSAPDFWSNRERAQGEVEEVSRLRSLLNPFRELERAAEDFEALQQLAAEEAIRRNARRQKEKSQTNMRGFCTNSRSLNCASFFPAKTTRSNAFLTIHSGAGGTESCDWADMLLRMYQRWIERSGFTSQTIDIQTGEEVGIKSATLLVQRRLRLRISQHRARRASARAHFAV